MNDHDHAQCARIYVSEVGDFIFSLRDGCSWPGHGDALGEHGYCPVCQH
ncbi:MAG: hypothetical protein ABR616_18090 [Dermatophilaceae bacterium]